MSVPFKFTVGCFLEPALYSSFVFNVTCISFVSGSNYDPFVIVVYCVHPQAFKWICVHVVI